MRARSTPRLSVFALCMGLLFGSAAAQAFGPDGHRIVAALAERQLAPATRAEVQRLLGAQASEGLPGLANWADEVRDQQAWRHTSRWHYVNFPRGTCRYDATRDCADGRCIVAALTDQARRLADRRLNDEDRLLALRFVVHFAGDLHQPLHAGYGDDRGGNTFQVFYIGRGSNLHALWDGGILRSSRLEWPQHVERLSERSTGTGSADIAWSRNAPVRWAEESCRLIDSAAIYPPRPGKLPDGYVADHYPLVERQLLIAGARLAALLDSALAPDRRRR